MALGWVVVGLGAVISKLGFGVFHPKNFHPKTTFIPTTFRCNTFWGATFLGEGSHPSGPHFSGPYPRMKVVMVCLSVCTYLLDVSRSGAMEIIHVYLTEHIQLIVCTELRCCVSPVETLLFKAFCMKSTQRVRARLSCFRSHPSTQCSLLFQQFSRWVHVTLLVPVHVEVRVGHVSINSVTYLFNQ